MYSDKLPGYVNDESDDIKNTFLGMLNNNDIEAYDLTSFLYENVYLKGYPTHFRLDHHWTIETSFKVYQHILDIFDSKKISYEKYDSSNFESRVFEETTIGSRGRDIAYGKRYLQKKDDFTLIYPSLDLNYSLTDLNGKESKKGNFLQIIDYDYLLNLDEYTYRYNVYYEIDNQILVNNSLNNDSTIVVIGDSYSIPICHFLTTNFKKVVLLDQRSSEIGNVEKYINENYKNIDAVIDLQYSTTLQDENFFKFFKE